jgi:hypothetical protein
MSDASEWPSIPYSQWRGTCETLHLWTQIVGKVRLALTPWVNHSWHATLYVTPRGLTTGVIPHERAFAIDFDFLDQALLIETVGGAQRRLPLGAGTIAEFHSSVLGALADLGVPVKIHGSPSEIADAVPFAQDHAPREYDGAAAQRYWRALVSVERVFKQFRTGYLGKASPVHLFWGSFDLAVTRFSGRNAPLHPGGVPNLPDAVAQEAYSHEVSSAGFWPGGGGVDDAAFYSYAYPEPEGFREARVAPAEAFYHGELREFVLPYEAVRAAADPERALLEFLESAYLAAAELGGWDREELECAPGRPRVPRAI